MFFRCSSVIFVCREWKDCQEPFGFQAFVWTFRLSRFFAQQQPRILFFGSKNIHAGCSRQRHHSLPQHRPNCSISLGATSLFNWTVCIIDILCLLGRCKHYWKKSRHRSICWKRAASTGDQVYFYHQFGVCRPSCWTSLVASMDLYHIIWLEWHSIPSNPVSGLHNCWYLHW